MNRLISVVVPVYNAEKYLMRCVDSILSQTYKDFELIMVDDGSMDSSGAMCDIIASQDSRVKVIHQQNAGAGAARNAGLATAEGDYVVFIDADDYVDIKYFELLAIHDEDVVFIDVRQADDFGTVLKEEYMSRYINMDRDKVLRSTMAGKIMWGGVRKCIKLSLINKYNVKYSSNQVGEEALYTYQVLLNAATIGFIQYPVYYYIQRSDSLSHIRINCYPLQGVANALEKHVRETGMWKRYGNTVNSFHMYATAVTADRLATNHTLKQYLQLIRDCVDGLEKTMDTSVGVDYENMSAKTRIMSILITNRLFRLIWVISRFRQKL